MTTPDQLDAELQQATKDLLELAADYAADSRSEAQKEAAYRLAYARALISIREFKNADERNAKALLMCEREFDDRLIAEGTAKGARAAFDACRDALSAIQTRAKLLQVDAEMNR